MPRSLLRFPSRLIRPASAALFALQLLGAASAQNVLVVVADDLGIDALARYASVTGIDPAGLPATPVIDGLAQTGVTFQQVWSNPICSPTRAAFQTGRYAFRSGCGTALPFGPALPQTESLIPEELAAAGQRVSTALIGKWHLGGSTFSLLGRLNPNLQGYDHFSGTIQSTFTGSYDYTSWLKVTDGLYSFSDQYATSVAVNDALAWLDGRREPWLCQVHFHAPHTPFHAPPAHLHNQTLPNVAPCDDPEPFFFAAIEALDTELGRLLAGLDPKVRAETTVVFFADNGSASQVVQGAASANQAKGTFFEPGLRVPLIVSGPAVTAPNTDCAALVSIVDLHDTLLELLGAPAPHDNDSISLLPYFESPQLPSLRPFLYAEHFHPPGPAPTFGDGTPCTFVGPIQWGTAIRNSHHKLIRPAGGPDQFYDLAADPYERVDLLAGQSLDPPQQSAYQSLSSALAGL